MSKKQHLALKKLQKKKKNRCKFQTSQTYLMHKRNLPKKSQFPTGTGNQTSHNPQLLAEKSCRF